MAANHQFFAFHPNVRLKTVNQRSKRSGVWRFDVLSVTKTSLKLCVWIKPLKRFNCIPTKHERQILPWKHTGAKSVIREPRFSFYNYFNEKHGRNIIINNKLLANPCFRHKLDSLTTEFFFRSIEIILWLHKRDLIRKREIYVKIYLINVYYQIMLIIISLVINYIVIYERG